MRPRGITAVVAAVAVVLAVAQAPHAEAATTSSVSLSASAAKVTVGSSVSLRAAAPRGRFASTDKVLFQRKVSGTWRGIAYRTLGSDGRTALSVKPALGTGYYRVLKPRTTKFTQAVSTTVKVVSVRITSSVVLTAGSTAVSEGATVDFTIQSPASAYTPGETVQLQTRRPGEAWAISKTLNLTSGGTAAAALTPPLGTSEFRAVKPQTDRYSAATSTPVTVTVSDKPEPVDPVVTVNGTGTSLAVTTSDPVARATFSVNEGEKVALATADIAGMSQPTVSVQDPDGVDIPLATLGNVSMNTRWSFVAPRSGTFTVLLSAAGGGAGSTRLVVTTPLTHAAAVNGAPQALTATPLPGRELRVTFAADNGEYLSSVIGNPVQWNQHAMRLVDVATGEEVEIVERDVQFGMWKIPADSDYRLELEPYAADAMAGDLSVSASRPAVATVNGPTIEASIDRPGDIEAYAVDLTEGQTVTLGVTYDGVDDNAAYLVEIRGAGDAPYGSVMGAQGLNDLKVWETGTYVLLLRGKGLTTPTFRLDISTPLAIAPELNGDPVHVSTVHAGRVVEGTVAADAGDVISLHTANATYGPTNPGRPVFDQVRLVNVASGQGVSPVDGRTDYTTIWQVPLNGEYRLVWSPTSAYTMTFDLSVLRAVPQPLNPNSPTSNVAIDRPGAVEAFTVPVTKGDRLAVAISSSDESRYHLNVSGAAGDAELYMTEREALVAAKTGVVNLVVQGPSSGTGAAPLHLDVTTPARKTAVLDGSPVTMTTGQNAGREMWAEFTAGKDDYVSYALANRVRWSTRQVRLVNASTGQSVWRVGAGERYQADPFETWKIPADGSYRFELEPAAATTMSADLTVSKTRAVPITVDVTTKRVSLARAGAPAVYTFSANAGVALALAQNGTFPGLDTPSGADLVVETPFGSTLLRTQVGPTITYSSMTPESTGTYTLVVRPKDGMTGTMSFRLSAP
ncbi:hypothetical protein [Aeromicrobium ginsengisoli]|uniref:Uncharacterized protein n=1 Tax=Aeromicrobium ginsengisoli TaxID=363867 RepID=A0A5M4FHE2_9ACTN|nr:hypothetical protein [Aeromicrobium ginsengisoli]KAA1399510.1 hypothetical protein ESP70_001715 [Aeromicrobium ginsengisoli]